MKKDSIEINMLYDVEIPVYISKAQIAQIVGIKGDSQDRSSKERVLIGLLSAGQTATISLSTKHGIVFTKQNNELP